MTEKTNTDVNIAEVPKKDIYRKGNICSNGTRLIDTLLQNHNIIIPSKRDSVFLK